MDLQVSRKVAYLMRQGVTSVKNGALGPAAFYFEQALQLLPGFYPAHYNLGWVYFKMGRRTEALQHFKEALQQADDDPRVLNNLALTLQELEDLPGSEDLFRKILSKDPLHPLAHYNFGRLQFSRGKFRSAISHWALISPDSIVWPKAILNLAIAFGRLKKWHKSLEYLRIAAHLWKDDLDFHLARAEAYEGLGKWNDACTEWRHIAHLARDKITRAFASSRSRALFNFLHRN